MNQMACARCAVELKDTGVCEAYRDNASAYYLAFDTMLSLGPCGSCLALTDAIGETSNIADMADRKTAIVTQLDAWQGDEAYFQKRMELSKNLNMMPTRICSIYAGDTYVQECGADDDAGAAEDENILSMQGVPKDLLDSLFPVEPIRVMVRGTDGLPLPHIKVVAFSWPHANFFEPLMDPSIRQGSSSDVEGQAFALLQDNVATSGADGWAVFTSLKVKGSTSKNINLYFYAMGVVVGWTNGDSRATIGRGIPRTKLYRPPLKLTSKVNMVAANAADVPQTVTEGQALGTNGALRVNVGSTSSNKCDQKSLDGRLAFALVVTDNLGRPLPGRIPRRIPGQRVKEMVNAVATVAGGAATFRNLQFSQAGPAGRYGVVFVVDGVESIVHMITVKSSVASIQVQPFDHRFVFTDQIKAIYGMSIEDRQRILERSVVTMKVFDKHGKGVGGKGVEMKLLGADGNPVGSKHLAIVRAPTPLGTMPVSDSATGLLIATFAAKYVTSASATDTDQTGVIYQSAAVAGATWAVFVDGIMAKASAPSDTKTFYRIKQGDSKAALGTCASLVFQDSYTPPANYHLLRPIMNPVTDNRAKDFASGEHLKAVNWRGQDLGTTIRFTFDPTHHLNRDDSVDTVVEEEERSNVDPFLWRQPLPTLDYSSEPRTSFPIKRYSGKTSTGTATSEYKLTYLVEMSQTFRQHEYTREQWLSGALTDASGEGLISQCVDRKDPEANSSDIHLFAGTLLATNATLRTAACQKLYSGVFDTVKKFVKVHSKYVFDRASYADKYNHFLLTDPAEIKECTSVTCISYLGPNNHTVWLRVSEPNGRFDECDSTEFDGKGVHKKESESAANQNQTASVVGRDPRIGCDQYSESQTLPILSSATPSAAITSDSSVAFAFSSPVRQGTPWDQPFQRARENKPTQIGDTYFWSPALGMSTFVASAPECRIIYELVVGDESDLQLVSKVKKYSSLYDALMNSADLRRFLVVVFNPSMVQYYTAMQGVFDGAFDSCFNDGTVRQGRPPTFQIGTPMSASRGGHTYEYQGYDLNGQAISTCYSDPVEISSEPDIAYIAVFQENRFSAKKPNPKQRLEALVEGAFKQAYPHGLTTGATGVDILKEAHTQGLWTESVPGKVLSTSKSYYTATVIRVAYIDHLGNISHRIAGQNVAFIQTGFESSAEYTTVKKLPLPVDEVVYDSFMSPKNALENSMDVTRYYEKSEVILDDRLASEVQLSARTRQQLRARVDPSRQDMLISFDSIFGSGSAPVTIQCTDPVLRKKLQSIRRRIPKDDPDGDKSTGWGTQDISELDGVPNLLARICVPTVLASGNLRLAWFELDSGVLNMKVWWEEWLSPDAFNAEQVRSLLIMLGLVRRRKCILH